MACQGGKPKSEPSFPRVVPPETVKAVIDGEAYMQTKDPIPDLSFPNAATKIKQTPDGQFLIASGIYPSQVKVHQLGEPSFKFEIPLDSKVIDFQILSDDYSKLAFLCEDCSLCLHAKNGRQCNIRIPRMGRDIAYNCWSSELLCAASSPDLYRIDLEQGCFLPSLSTRSPALNVVSRSKHLGIVACGGEDGVVECFDSRVKSSLGRLNAVSLAGDTTQEVTALEFNDDGGFLMAVGSSAGKVLIYDLRCFYPIQVKDHMHVSRILDIKWHQTPYSERTSVITTDNRAARLWDPEAGNSVASIEPTPGTINDICVCRESGLMLLALNCCQLPSYFIPSLGHCPKWCPDIETPMVEIEDEMLAPRPCVYKYLTKNEVEPFLMWLRSNEFLFYHGGYFVEFEAYRRALYHVDPNAEITETDLLAHSYSREAFIEPTRKPKHLPSQKGTLLEERKGKMMKLLGEEKRKKHKAVIQKSRDRELAMKRRIEETERGGIED